MNAASLRLTPAKFQTPTVHHPTTGDPQIEELYSWVTASQFLLARDRNASGCASTSSGGDQSIAHVKPVQRSNACPLTAASSLGPAAQVQ